MKRLRFKKDNNEYLTADEKRFIENSELKVGDPNYTSGHSIDADGNCNMGCC